MKRPLIRFLSVLLCVSLLLPCAGFLSFAENEAVVPKIFLDGINSSATLDSTTGEVVYPPTFDTIVGALKGNLLPTVSSLIKGDFDAMTDPVSDAVIKIFEPIAMDENGQPLYPTVADFSYPTKEEIDTIMSEGGKTGTIAFDTHYIHYTYDWRLDMQTIAADFHDFVEYILDQTGAEQVDVVSFSMGTCVLLTYMKVYDCEYLRHVVLDAGAFNGVTTTGEPFVGDITFDSKALVTYLSTMVGENMGMALLDAVIKSLYQIGVVDRVTELANRIVAGASDQLYEKAFRRVFSRIPGFWSLVPYELYDRAKEMLIVPGEFVTDEYVAKLDFYHEQIQGQNVQILSDALDKGVQFSIIAKYGSMIPPVCDHQTNIGDSVIDTYRESLGATCSVIGETLGEDYTQAVDDGHDHLSADGQIDASTCAFPEYTWFLKGRNHSEHVSDEFAFTDWLLSRDAQPTVWDSELYPQFMILDRETQVYVPLTAENNYERYEPVERGETFFARIRNLFGIMRDFFRTLFGSMFKKQANTIS